MKRRHFEVCIFSYLAAELKSGDIYILGSESYGDYRLQLLTWSECEPKIGEYCQNLGLPPDADGLIEHLQAWLRLRLRSASTPSVVEVLRETAQSVDQDYPNNTSVVINETGEPVLKRPSRQSHRSSLQALEALIQERMSERNLIDLLRNVDYWTNFTRHFGPFSGSDPKLDRAHERYLLTTFTYGCNLGPTQAARHIGVLSPRRCWLLLTNATLV
ncbi:MAG: Tn3 family transposase [Cyanobacteria bacterium]|jgi:hypothetical protein|nr:Tn3 family transposase [Cyanobacteria bacterium GSL.Bin1]